MGSLGSCPESLPISPGALRGAIWRASLRVSDKAARLGNCGHEELITFGDLQSTEVWQDVGNALNPLQPNNGYMMHPSADRNLRLAAMRFLNRWALRTAGRARPAPTGAGAALTPTQVRREPGVRPPRRKPLGLPPRA